MADETQPLDAPADLVAQPAEASPSPTPEMAQFDRTDARSLIITALLAFAGYYFTLAPNVTLEWSGIHATSAHYAGASAPPGYPVWTLYAWFFSHLILFWNIAWRIALSSAVASALACGVVALMVSYAGKLVFCGAAAFPRLSQRDQNRLRVVCGCVAGLVLGFADNVWRYAVIADTKSLGLSLFAGILCLLMRWFFEPSRTRYLCGAFLIFGLLLTNNQELLVAVPGLVAAAMLGRRSTGRDLSLFVLPLAAGAAWINQYSVVLRYTYVKTLYEQIDWPMTIGFLLALLAGIGLAANTRRAGTEWRCALGCGLCLLLGLAFYFYVPIAGMTVPPVNWGYPRTLEGFVHLVSQGQFERVHPVQSLVDYGFQIGMLVVLTGKQFGWIYLAFAMVPFACFRCLTPLGRRWLSGLTAMFLCAYFILLAILNPLPDSHYMERIAVYFIPSFVILAVFMGLGLMSLGARMGCPPVTAEG